jgi:hypothetical protein
MIRKYAAAYTKIITAKGFHPFYIEGFARRGAFIFPKRLENMFRAVPWGRVWRASK